jgi:hypothetical protein
MKVAQLFYIPCFNKSLKIVRNSAAGTCQGVTNYIDTVEEVHTLFHVKRVPCQHGKTRPRVADGTNGFRI